MDEKAHDGILEIPPIERRLHRKLGADPQRERTPDAMDRYGGGENPQWVYTVVFDATEVWGEGADPTLTISIDAWESYLEPA